MPLICKRTNLGSCLLYLACVPCFINIKAIFLHLCHPRVRCQATRNHLSNLKTTGIIQTSQTSAVPPASPCLAFPMEAPVKAGAAAMPSSPSLLPPDRIGVSMEALCGIPGLSSLGLVSTINFVFLSLSCLLLWPHLTHCLIKNTKHTLFKATWKLS